MLIKKVASKTVHNVLELINKSGPNTTLTYLTLFPLEILVVVEDGGENTKRRKDFDATWIPFFSRFTLR